MLEWRDADGRVWIRLYMVCACERCSMRERRYERAVCADEWRDEVSGGATWAGLIESVKP